MNEHLSVVSKIYSGFFSLTIAGTQIVNHILEDMLGDVTRKKKCQQAHHSPQNGTHYMNIDK